MLHRPTKAPFPSSDIDLSHGQEPENLREYDRLYLTACAVVLPG
jgi:hypothetical protein